MLRSTSVKNNHITGSTSSTEQIILFNSKNTKMLICDLLEWSSPDNSSIIVAFTVPCPNCGYPIITRPDQISLVYSVDKKLSLMQKIVCPARWRQVDQSGIVDVDDDGNPMIVRCGWSCNGISNNVLREDDPEQ